MNSPITQTWSSPSKIPYYEAQPAPKKIPNFKWTESPTGESCPEVSDWSEKLVYQTPPNKGIGREEMLQRSPVKHKKHIVYDLEPVKKKLAFDDCKEANNIFANIEISNDKKSKQNKERIQVLKLR